ncbi:secreted protein [Candidatus Magnetomorum sp. HK-1]|nr:secreted protein [Candidatus Magnetomorum sp. HK-1]
MKRLCLISILFVYFFSIQTLSAETGAFRIKGSSIIIPIKLMQNIENIEGIDISILLYSQSDVHIQGRLTGGLFDEKNYVLNLGYQEKNLKLAFFANGSLVSGQGIIAFLKLSFDNSIYDTCQLSINSSYCNDQPINTGFFVNTKMFQKIELHEQLLDINCNEQSDLGDIIYALKLMSGFDLSSGKHFCPLLEGVNHKTELPDVLNIFQKMSESN